MARPKSENKRNAILEAATRVIDKYGLGASTAHIAKEAGIANGSLFTYFETKDELFNQLYLSLKTDMATAAMDQLPTDVPLQEQLFHTWKNWMNWAIASPEKQRVLAKLFFYDDIRPEILEACHQVMAGISCLLENYRERGSMRNVSKMFVVSIVNALAETTMNFMIQEPENAQEHCKVGFDVILRMLS